MENLKLDDFLTYSFISRLEYSPSGETAAFVVSRADLDENGYTSDIYLLDACCGEPRRLTAKGDVRGFIWLSDTELLFPSMCNAKNKARAESGETLTVFYKISTLGGEAAEYFRLPLAAGAIKKIDGSRFALLCTWHPDYKDFSKLSEAEKAAELKRIKAERDYEVLDEIPFWQNGAGFTNKKRTRLYVYDMNAGEAKPLSDEHTEVESFFIDGGSIVYLGTSFTDKMPLVSGAYCVDAATGETKTIIPQRDDGDSVDFIHPWNGGYIAKCSDRKTYGMGQFGNFYTIKDGKTSLLLEMDEAAGNMTNSDCRYGGGTGIRVTDDGIYYTAVEHMSNALRKITPDGAVRTLLKQNDTIDGFDVRDGRVIFFGLGALYLHEIFLLDGSKPRKLTSINEQALRGKKLSLPEQLTAKGEWETVEGYVMKPVDFDPAKKYPAVMNIHGGPKTAFGDSFFHENQLLANMGYFVVICNPWGSDGRGDNFADLRGRYGTVDYNDLMTFMDAAIDAYPQIDRARLAVEGGSYGGFMTNWIIGHTDRFCCAASQRSISNWIAKFGTTDIGYFFNADQQQSTPWDNQEKMWWHSPMKYADKVKTPTLFIHSEQDYRCWLVEGLQMFTSLKYHGVEARLCMFRGENHELSRSGKPAHRIRRLTEITSWFEKYCK